MLLMLAGAVVIGGEF